MKKLILIVLLVCFLVTMIPGSALCTESDYYGMYAGTYSGDDGGYWTAFISVADNVYLSYSMVTEYGDGCHIHYRDESDSIGEYYGWSAIQNTSIDPIHIDSTTGSVSGEWKNYPHEEGTLKGSKITSSIYDGLYSGNIDGDATGSWEMTIESNGHITGTATVEEETASFEGGVHPTGYFATVGTDPDNNDFAVYGQINETIVSGGWISESGSESTISGNKDSDIEEDGGCFMSTTFE